MHERERWAVVPDLWDDGRAINYWIWRDDRLVPVTCDGHAQVPEDKRPCCALHHLGQSEIIDLREARRTRRHCTAMYMPFVGYPLFVLPLPLAERSRRRISHKEGAHAKQSVTRRQAP